MSRDYSTIQQHQPLRVPSGWEKQEKALIVQLDEIFDDIYRRFGRLRIEDMGEKFRSEYADMSGNVAELTYDVTGLTTRMGNAEGDISSLQLTAGGLTTRMENAEGSIATLQLTATSLTSSIGNWTSQSTITQTISSLDSRISSLGYGTVYMQPEEPDHAELVQGDIWIQTQPSGTWEQVYQDYASWSEIYSRMSTWQTLGGAPVMWVWDGRKWQKQLDSLEADTLETEIQQNAQQIQLLATRTTAVEGDLNNKYTIRSGIAITAEGISISGSQYVKIASGGVFEVTTGTFGIDSDSTTYVIWSGAASAASSPFWVKKDGSVHATSGDIGGFTLGANSMSSGSGTAYIALNTASNNDYAIWAGNATAASAPFSVKKNGAIKATSGTVGGFTLGANRLTSGTGSWTVALDSDSSGTYAIWAGASAAASAPFRVKRDGTVYLTSLIAVGEDGTETTVNLRTAGLWKLGYGTVKSVTVSGGYCTGMTFSNAVGGYSSVNFNHAAPVTLAGAWSGGSGSPAYAYIVTASTGQTVNSGTVRAQRINDGSTGDTSIKVRIATDTATVRDTVIDVKDIWKKGWLDCKAAATSVVRYTRNNGGGYGGDSVTHYVRSGSGTSVTYTPIGTGWWKTTSANAWTLPDDPE